MIGIPAPCRRRQKRRKINLAPKIRVNSTEIPPVSEMINQGRHVCEQTLSRKKKKESRFRAICKLICQAVVFVRPCSYVGRVRKFDLREIFICMRSVCKCVCCYLGKIWQSNETLFSLCWTYYAGVMNDFFPPFFSFRISFSFVGSRARACFLLPWLIDISLRLLLGRGKRKDTFLCVCKQPQPG